MSVDTDTRISHLPLLCALDRAPWLVVQSPSGSRPIPVPPTDGSAPAAPRSSPDGHVAYVQVASRRASSAWTCALVLLGPGGDVLDLRPSVFVHAPPAFSPDGACLLYVRDFDDLAREVVALDLTNGAERTLTAGDGIRSAAWSPDGRVVISTTDSIESICPSTQVRDRLHVDTVATGFARFGTDDLYVTLDAVAVSPLGELAWARSWHQQGRPSRTDVR